MSTPQEDPAQVIRGLVALTRKRIIGQDAAVEVFAAETYSHIALGPLQRRPGVFLIAGPNVEEDHLDLVGGLVQSLKSMGGLYKLAGNPGRGYRPYLLIVPRCNGSGLVAAGSEGQS